MAGVHQMLIGGGRGITNPVMNGPPVGTSSSTGTTMAATIPANVSGDILVLWVHEWTLSLLSPTAPSVSGWNLIGSTGYDGSSPQGASMWWRESTGSNLSANITFAVSGTVRTALGMVFDGASVFKNPNPALACTFGAAQTLDPPNQGSLFTNNMWLALLGTGSIVTGYPAGMLGLVNYSSISGGSACAALGSYTLTAYDPAPFSADGVVAAVPCTFVIVGSG